MSHHRSQLKVNQSRMTNKEQKSLPVICFTFKWRQVISYSSHRIAAMEKKAKNVG